MVRQRMLLLAGVVGLLGCGSSGGGGQGGGSGGHQGTGGTVTTDGGAGATGDVGTPGAGSGGAGPPPTTMACDTYCTAITANCTGANVQYKDKADCMATCPYLPAGAPGDTSGDSIACRTNAAMMAAKDTSNPKSTCWAAGPLGYGTCGEECDAFCEIALAYCSPAKGYTGPTVYATFDQCRHNICPNLGRVIEFDKPGHYSGAYTPTGMPETTDTLECRAYHLIVNALSSTANQATHCPHAGNVSAPCGPGYTAPTGGGSDGGTTGDAAPGTVYMGKNIINKSNWDETKYPFATRRMILRDEGNPRLHLVDLGHPGDPQYNWSTPTDGAWARAAQLIGHNQLLGGRNDGYEVYDLADGHIVKQVKGFANTMSAYRMANGETMLTQTGTKLTFLDKDDKVSHTISYPGYGYVRMARPTRNGTFLVPSDSTLFEGDASGKVLWTAHGTGWGHIWEPLLMESGDTLLCTAFGASCDVVDKTTHMVTFRYGGKTLPAEYRANFFAEFEILPNGNIITSNWQGHGTGNGASGIQVIEFDPKGNVAWSWKQDATQFSSIQGVMVLDGKDPQYLHVQETSTDSTWQPVIPTP